MSDEIEDLIERAYESLENKCPFDDMDNQRCHAFNDGDCMNGIVCEKKGKNIHTDIYGVNTPLDFQSNNHEQRFFKPR